MKSTGCVLDWKGGTRDWSRYHHTLTEHNTIPVRSVNGEARHFNGINAFLDCGNASAFDITDAITIEVWVKTSGGKYQGLIQKSDTESTKYGFMCRLNLNNTVVLLIGNGSSYGELASLSAITLNVWNHLVFQFDNSTKTVNYYINGVLDKTGTINIDITYNSDALNIGRQGSNDFIGTICEARIYNRALTLLEIWNNYQVMKPYIPLSKSLVAIV